MLAGGKEMQQAMSEQDEMCDQLLRDLTTVAQLSQIAPTLQEANLSHGLYRIRKGTTNPILRETASLRAVAEKLTQDLWKINFDFEEEVKIIDE